MTCIIELLDHAVMMVMYVWNSAVKALYNNTPHACMHDCKCYTIPSCMSYMIVHRRIVGIWVALYSMARADADCDCTGAASQIPCMACLYALASYSPAVCKAIPVSLALHACCV